MTNEELKAEFAKYLSDSIDYYSTKEPLTDRKLLQIWLDCAEPREKKILELTKENEQIKQSNWELLMKIEKMKCCHNCDVYLNEDAYDLCKFCNEFSRWELVK